MKHLSRYWHLLLCGAILIALYIYPLQPMGKEKNAQFADPKAHAIYQQWLENNKDFVKPSNAVLQKNLSQLQYNVTQNDDTEQPFKNTYWDNKQPGIYVDVISGEPLFSSQHKYKSGTGWPSFFRPISDQAMVTKEDRLLVFVRTELKSNQASSHLGHVFDDGPQPTGKRYCINSAALRFIPQNDLVKEGYAEFLSLFAD